MSQNNISQVNFSVQSLVASIRQAALEVYRELQSSSYSDMIYEACLKKELNFLNIPYISLAPFPVFYKGERIDGFGFSVFLLVEDKILVEIDNSFEIEEGSEKTARKNLELCGKEHCLIINFKYEGEKNFIRHIKA